MAIVGILGFISQPKSQPPRVRKLGAEQAIDHAKFPHVSWDVGIALRPLHKPFPPCSFVQHQLLVVHWAR